MDQQTDKRISWYTFDITFVEPNFIVATHIDGKLVNCHNFRDGLVGKEKTRIPGPEVNGKAGPLWKIVVHGMRMMCLE